MDAQGKKQTLLMYLARGVAMVHLDARRKGVLVPEQFHEDAHLRLNLSYRYSIPDLDIDDARVQATLSFGGVPFRCIMPWDCIFGITSQATGDGQIWPEDLPTGVIQPLPPPQQAEAAAAPQKPALPRLEAVALERAPEELDAGHTERPHGPAPEAKPRPHLRLVR